MYNELGREFRFGKPLKRFPMNHLWLQQLTKLKVATRLKTLMGVKAMRVI